MKVPLTPSSMEMKEAEKFPLNLTNLTNLIEAANDDNSMDKNNNADKYMCK